jgi:hypothetical protein
MGGWFGISPATHPDTGKYYFFNFLTSKSRGKEGFNNKEKKNESN